MSDIDESGEAPTQASAVDETQRKRRETKKQRQEREDRDFFALVMASEAGRRFLWSILSSCHTFETRFANGPVGFPDPLATWFEFGAQQTGTRLYQTWTLKNPEQSMAMLRENDPRFLQIDL